jgi:RNA polymerase sigma factor (sigma-70 family)
MTPAVSHYGSDTMESQLVSLAQTGDREAFSRLVTLYSRRIYRLAYSFLHNVDDAADVVQEVFLRAYRSLSRFDTSRAFYPWLHRITRNLCLNRRALKANREGSLPVDDPPPPVVPGARVWGDPVASTLANEDVASLRSAIDRLPEMHRNILILKHFQECSYAEMAELLDIPVGTVMSRLHNARQKLKILLEEAENQCNAMKQG